MYGAMALISVPLRTNPHIVIPSLPDNGPDPEYTSCWKIGQPDRHPGPISCDAAQVFCDMLPDESYKFGEQVEMAVIKEAPTGKIKLMGYRPWSNGTTYGKQSHLCKLMVDNCCKGGATEIYGSRIGWNKLATAKGGLYLLNSDSLISDML